MRAVVRCGHEAAVVVAVHEQLFEQRGHDALAVVAAHIRLSGLSGGRRAAVASRG